MVPTVPTSPKSTLGTTLPPAGGPAASVVPDPTVVPAATDDSSIEWTTELGPTVPSPIIYSLVANFGEVDLFPADDGNTESARLDSSSPSTLSASIPPGVDVSVFGAGCPTLGTPFNTSPAQVLVCTYVFRRAPADTTLTIQNAVLPGTDTTTSFAYSIPEAVSPTSFSLTGSDSQAVTVPTSTALTLTETLPPGWSSTLSGTGCPPATSSGTSLTASFNLAGPLTCTVTNTQLATIAIQKTTVGGDGSFTFDEPVLGQRSVTTVAEVGSVSYTDVAPGTYTFSEAPVDGWVAGQFGGNCAADGTVTVVAGESATCTIANTKLASIVSIPTTIVVSPTTIAPPTVAAPPGGSAGASNLTTSNQAPSSIGGSGFAITGSRSRDVALLAAMLLVAGLSLVSFSRRRRRRATN